MGACEGTSKILLIIGALLLGFCGYYVARPNLYGHKFEEKECNITLSYVSTDYESCSCGDECYSVYPCIVVQVNIVYVVCTYYILCIMYNLYMVHYTLYNIHCSSRAYRKSQILKIFILGQLLG